MEEKASRTPAWGGRFAALMTTLGSSTDRAVKEAFAWTDEAPGDVLALIGLGEALEAAQRPDDAARAYGSIIDLFPGRADLRRHASARLERLGTRSALALAVDSYRKSVADRPDHPSGHRGLAMALVRSGDVMGALDALETGLDQRYPGRFPGVMRILREDLQIVAQVAKEQQPKSADAIRARLKARGLEPATTETLRFVLSWETDANDVDFHIHDARGGHAYYSSPHLPSGGDLYADVTRGYGPECFAISGKPTAGPYRLEAHYYSKGPMGYGMGRVQILRHDGAGRLDIEERPFVVMNDGAFVPLGTVDPAVKGARGSR